MLAFADLSLYSAYGNIVYHSAHVLTDRFHLRIDHSIKDYYMHTNYYNQFPIWSDSNEYSTLSIRISIGISLLFFAPSLCISLQKCCGLLIFNCTNWRVCRLLSSAFYQNWISHLAVVLTLQKHFQYFLLARWNTS